MQSGQAQEQAQDISFRRSIYQGFARRDKIFVDVAEIAAGERHREARPNRPTLKSTYSIIKFFGDGIPIN